MSEQLSTRTNTVRNRVVLFLALLASRECQEACREFLPSDKLAFELCRLWFDEIYVPGSRYLDAFKGDRSAADVAQFQEYFADEEQAALERFHRFLELRLDMLPEHAKKQGVFPQNDLWQSIVRDAGHVLEALGADVELLQRQLRWIVQLALNRAEHD